MRVLFTGTAGFICGYLISERLSPRHEIVRVDNVNEMLDGIISWIRGEPQAART